PGAERVRRRVLVRLVVAVGAAELVVVIPHADRQRLVDVLERRRRARVLQAWRKAFCVAPCELAREYVARTSLRVAAEDATDRIAVGRREVLAHAGRVGLPRPLPVDLVDHVAVDDPRMGAGARVARDELVARGEARRGAAAAV